MDEEDLTETCPYCGSKKLEHYSRITGYYQRVSGWNRGKRQELRDRKHYNMGDGGDE